VRITRNRLFYTKTQMYDQIWGNSYKIVFAGCTHRRWWTKKRNWR